MRKMKSVASLLDECNKGGGTCTYSLKGRIMMKYPIVIVGAGLSGLRVASLLAKHGIDFNILEARDRIGGRVLSKSMPNGLSAEKFDLGPS